MEQINYWTVLQLLTKLPRIRISTISLHALSNFNSRIQRKVNLQQASILIGRLPRRSWRSYRNHFPFLFCNCKADRIPQLYFKNDLEVI
jgi:hypothetical protein